MFKWILAAGGYFLLGKNFLGAILGFFIGNLIDNYQNVVRTAKTQAQKEGRSYNPEDLFQYYQQRSSQNDIPTMLMALSAAIMKADGKVLKAELDYVKLFLNNQFGPGYASTHLKTLKHFIDSDDIPLQQICLDIKMRTMPEVRVQLIHYLFGIAKSDGTVSTSEINVLNQIASLMGVPAIEFESVKNMFYRDVNSDYAVLGIGSEASDDEVKKAYRQMAIKFHPDKVASMGEEYQKGAKEKFQKIQEAYENIKKNRNMK